MAKAKTVKINGQKFKDGDKVTLVIQATVKVSDKTLFSGTERRDVEFVSDSKEHYLDAWESDKKPGQFEIHDAAVVKR